MQTLGRRRANQTIATAESVTEVATFVSDVSWDISVSHGRGARLGPQRSGRWFDVATGPAFDPWDEAELF
jgi:hypothetical protein